MSPELAKRERDDSLHRFGGKPVAPKIATNVVAEFELSIFTSIEETDPDQVASADDDPQHKVPAVGQRGGVDGAFEKCAGLSLSIRPPGKPPHNERIRHASLHSRKVTRLKLPKGSTLELHCGGGGGFGPPEERPIEAVLADVREGYLSEANARKFYPHAFAALDVAAAE